MFEINPAWAGRVQFYELFFGFAPAYALLVLVWERLLRVPMPEWRYLLVTVLCAATFLVNHYFQYAPYWMIAINVYAAFFIIVFGCVMVLPAPKSKLWRIVLFPSGLLFAIGFSRLELIARTGVNQYGIHEFWFMLAAFAFFVALIFWRRR